MTGKFNAGEVFEIAEQIERNGQAFYRKAAETVDNEEAREFLLELAAMEVEHEDFFKNLKEKFDLTPGGDFPDPDETMVAYLQALVDGDVFNSIKTPIDRIAEGASLQEIIQMAIDFERNTVAYFAGIKMVVPEDLGQDKIDSLIREEMSHIAILSIKKKAYADS